MNYGSIRNNLVVDPFNSGSVGDIHIIACAVIRFFKPVFQPCDPRKLYLLIPSYPGGRKAKIFCLRNRNIKDDKLIAQKEFCFETSVDAYDSVKLNTIIRSL